MPGESTGIDSCKPKNKWQSHCVVSVNPVKQIFVKKQDKIFPQLFYKKDRKLRTSTSCHGWFPERIHIKFPKLCSSTVAIHSTYLYEGWWMLFPRNSLKLTAPHPKIPSKGRKSDFFGVLAHFYWAFAASVMECFLGVFQVGDSAPIRELPT